MTRLYMSTVYQPVPVQKANSHNYVENVNKIKEIYLIYTCIPFSLSPLSSSSSSSSSHNNNNNNNKLTIKKKETNNKKLKLYK